MNTWEVVDERGLLMPWYTHSALEVIRRWDITGKVVLEYGGGHSTKWWASRAKHVHTIEADRHWYQTICGWGLANVEVHLRDANPAGRYAQVPDGCRPDVVIIDGEHRLECLKATLALPRPLTLIFDNWQQDFVFVDATAEAMMQPYSGRFYVQPDHRNHAGKPWQTAIWDLV